MVQTATLGTEIKTNPSCFKNFKYFLKSSKDHKDVQAHRKK